MKTNPSKTPSSPAEKQSQLPVQCPLCGSGNTRHLVNWAEDSTILRCANCQVLFAHPLPSDHSLQAFYQGFLYRKPDRESIRQSVEMKKAELTRLFHLGKGKMQGKKLLDYGGGSGIAFQAGRELGCDVFYYDVDNRAVSFVREQFGLEIDRLIERPSDLGKYRFDLILSDNVLEHAPSPLSMVRMLLDALEVEGRLVLKTPHARTSDLFFCPKVILGGYLAKARKHNSLATTFSALFWNRFWTCDPPRHLFSFSRKSIIEIMRTLGIGKECYAISYYHVPLFEYSLTRDFLQRPKTFLGFVRRLLSLPLLLIELVSKAIQVSLRVLQITSPGGIILRVDKRPNGRLSARASN